MADKHALPRKGDGHRPMLVDCELAIERATDIMAGKAKAAFRCDYLVKGTKCTEGGCRKGGESKQGCARRRISR